MLDCQRYSVADSGFGRFFAGQLALHRSGFYCAYRSRPTVDHCWGDPWLRYALIGPAKVAKWLLVFSWCRCCSCDSTSQLAAGQTRGVCVCFGLSLCLSLHHFCKQFRARACCHIFFVLQDTCQRSTLFKASHTYIHQSPDMGTSQQSGPLPASLH